MAYAKNTTVPIDRSMVQIRRLLTKGGSDGVAIATTNDGACVQFIYEKMPYKFHVKYPTYRDDNIKYTNTGRVRTDIQMDREIESEVRRLWRALHLYVKAAIEAHDNGIIDLKRSLMGNLQINGGMTVYDKFKGDMKRLTTSATLFLE